VDSNPVPPSLASRVWLLYNVDMEHPDPPSRRTIRANPLFKRLTRRDTFPAPGVTAPLGLATAAAGLALPVLAFLRGDFHLAVVAADVAQVIMSLLAPVTASLAAILTAREAQSGAYQLLRLTDLPAGERVRGYVFAALHRLRLPLALALGLMPALVIGRLIASLSDPGMARRLILGTCTAPICELAAENWARVDPVGPTLAFVALGLGLWGLSLPGAALGVGLALWWRQGIPAAIAASLGAALGAALIWLGAAVVDVQLTDLSAFWQPARRLIIPAMALAPYLLALAVMRLARRWT
jgi:hypothetical protein